MAKTAAKIQEIQPTPVQDHGPPVCRESACENLAIAAGYCRPHYIKNWTQIKRKEAILKDGRLKQYIRELVFKYSDKYIQALRHDLQDDAAFARAIAELNLPETTEELMSIDTSDLLEESHPENIKPEMEDVNESD